MKYAKLINGYPQFAPNPILVDGNWIGNPPGEIYLEQGYKPVTFTEPPGEPDEGYMWQEKWVETGGEILQQWALVEEGDVDPAEAMDILFGGEG